MGFNSGFKGLKSVELFLLPKSLNGNYITYYSGILYLEHNLKPVQGMEIWSSRVQNHHYVT